jgi:hypothetical protein
LPHWWRTNEYWIPNNAWTLLALSRLHAARCPGAGVTSDPDLQTWLGGLVNQ